MSSNGVESPPKASSPRARHQITRSISELSSPTKLHRHHQRHHRHHRSERTLDDTPQSANPALEGRSSLDVTRREKATPNMSPDASRRTSALLFGNENNPEWLTPPSHAARKVDTEEELREEKEKTVSRVTGLKKSLIDLGDFSNTTTRRLDDTYYAVLEKTSVLQSTIIALKELAIMSRETTASFEIESREMVQQIEGQLDSIGQFEDKEKHLESLNERIQTGRTKVDVLSARVDVVRERIESWERADAEWQERTRKRLKVIWIIMSVIFAAMILLFVGAQYAPPISEVTGLDSPNATISMSSKEVGQSNAFGQRPDGAASERAIPSLWAERVGNEDDRLRFFDEL